MEDPRNQVVYAPFILNRKGENVWSIGCNRPAPWHVAVAFANAILAANEAWLDSTTPTLAELRERYPEWSLSTHFVPGVGCFSAAVRYKCTINSIVPLEDEQEAIRWLAAELAKVNE